MEDISSGKNLYVVVGYSGVGIHRKTSTFSVAGPRTTILSCLRSLLTESGKQEATASPEQEASLFTFFVKYSRPRPASCFVEVESWDRPFRLSRALPGSGKVEIKEKLKIRYFDNLIFQKSHYSIMSTSSFSRSRQLRGFSSGHPESLGHRCWCSVVLVRTAQADRDAPRAPGEAPEHRAFKFRFFHPSNNS